MQDTEITKPVSKLFSSEAMVMGVILSVIGWGCLEIVSNKEALASMTEKHTVINKSFSIISETSSTLLRMEVSQEFFKDSINKDIIEIKKSLSLLNERVQFKPNREYK
jgi:hypothetical protein